MASVVERKDEFDIVTGNDADADRHGIVTPDGGLMNPNHYLAVAIDYLYAHRPDWRARRRDRQDARLVVDHRPRRRRPRPPALGGAGRVQVVRPGLVDGSVAFGGEESAGASFLRRDGSVWTTDKDGIILALLASEILAVTGKSPSVLYRELTERFGDPVYQRVDAAASKEQKARLGKLSGDDITATELAGDPIIAKLSEAPGNGAAVGGVKVVTEKAWFAARPSGTEDVYKIYAESFEGPGAPEARAGARRKRSSTRRSAPSGCPRRCGRRAAARSPCRCAVAVSRAQSRGGPPARAREPQSAGAPIAAQPEPRSARGCGDSLPARDQARASRSRP